MRILPGLLLLLLARFAIAQNEAGEGLRGARALAPSALSNPAGTTRALIIGISDYQDPEITDLRFAHRDAEAFAEFLQSPAGGSVPAEQIKVLLNENARFGNVIREIKKLTLSCNPGDRVVIYFSGHGDVENDLTLDQPGYLLCWDTPSDVYDAGGLDIQVLERHLNEISIARKSKLLLITDACRSGKLAGSHIRGPMLTNSQLKERFANEVLLLSCQPNEFSVENERWGDGRGVFSYFLLNGLYGLADADLDMQVLLKEIRRYLEDQVPAEAKRASGLPQNPVVNGDMESLLTYVNESQKNTIQSESAPVSVNAGTKGKFDPLTFISDSSILELYKAFQGALARGDLLTPAGRSANDYYERLIREDSLAGIHTFLALDFAAALINDAQQAIGDYIRSQRHAVEYMRRPDLLKFSLYADYVEKAAGLLGEDDFFYNQLKAMENFFRARTLQVEQYLGRTTLTPAVQQRLFCEYCQEGLQFDSTASYLYALLGHGNCNGRAPAHYRRALQLSPAWLQAYIWTAEELEKTDSMGAALNTVLQAIRMDSTYALGYRKMTQLQVIGGNYDEAIRMGEKALTLDSVYTDPWYNDWLPAAYLLQHRYDHFLDYRKKQAAELQGRETAELPLRGARWLLELADYYLESGQFAPAKTNYESALTLAGEPELQFRARWGLGWLALMQNKPGEAESLFRQVSTPAGLTGLGLAYRQRREYRLADSLFLLALRQDTVREKTGVSPADRFIIEGNTILAFAPRMVEDVVYLYELAAGEVFRNEPKIRYNLGMALKNPAGKYKRAIRVFESVSGPLTLNQESLYAIAVTYAQWGKPKKAMNALEEALEQGFSGVHRIQTDREWNNLRDHKRFKALLAKHFPETRN